MTILKNLISHFQKVRLVRSNTQHAKNESSNEIVPFILNSSNNYQGNLIVEFKQH